MRISNLPSLDYLNNISPEIAIFTVIGANAIREAKKECSLKNIAKAGLKAIVNCGTAFSALYMYRNGIHPVAVQFLAGSVAANYLFEKWMTDSPLLSALKKNDVGKIHTILHPLSTRKKLELLNEKYHNQTLLNYAFMECSDELVKAILDSPSNSTEKESFIEALFPLHQNDLLLQPLIKLKTMVMSGKLDEKTTSLLINAIWDKLAPPRSLGSLITPFLNFLLKSVYEKYPTIVKGLFSPTFDSYPGEVSEDLLSVSDFANIFKFSMLESFFPKEFIAHIDQVSMKKKKQFFEHLTPEQAARFIQEYRKLPSAKTKQVLSTLQNDLSDNERLKALKAGDATIIQNIRTIFSKISALDLALAAARSRYRFVMHNTLPILEDKQLKFIVPRLNERKLVQYMRKSMDPKKHIPILKAFTTRQAHEYLINCPIETLYFPDWDEKRADFTKRLSEIETCTTETEKNKKIYQLKRDFDEFSEKEFSTLDEACITIEAILLVYLNKYHHVGYETIENLKKNGDKELFDLMQVLDSALSKIYSRWGLIDHLPGEGSIYKEYNELFPKIEGLTLEVDERFLDFITKKLMSDPCIIPDTIGESGSSLHIDVKTLQKLKQVPQKEGEVLYINPYNRSQDRASAYLLDTALQKEINVWKAPLEN